MNVPLFILGVRKMGLRLLVSSICAMTVSSAMIDLMDAFYTFAPMEPMLACIYGGVLLGLSMGLMMRVGATTGGTELGARLLKYRLRYLSIGKLCLAIDVSIIVLYALVFRSVNNALYGIVAMYISTLVMDMVVYGSVSAKMAYIISDRSDQVVEQLLERDMGVTILPGQGAYTGKDKKIVLCAFKPRQIAAVKGIVRQVDPGAFIIVCDAHEILGEGFGENSPDSL